MNGVPCEGFDYDFDDCTDNSSAGPDGPPSYGYIPYGKPPAFPIGEFTVRIGPQLLFATEYPIRLREKENSLAHHTDRYKLVENPDRMIVRRAAAFQIEVTGENELDEQCSLIHFTATHTFDGDPVEIDIPLFEGSVVPPDAWGCRVVHVEGRDPKKLLVDVHIPMDAAIGQYAFKAQFGPNGRPEILDEVEFPKKVVVLFNPWGETDAVSYPDETHLAGYLLDENQTIAKAREVDDVSWNFDQFTEEVLDGTFTLLEPLNAQNRGDPAKVCRALAEMLNAGRIDELGIVDLRNSGVLVANWTSNYFGYASPLEWRSSSSIFYVWRVSGNPARWGECWNFAAISTSAMRTLGIPARTLTCRNAGRDIRHPFDGNIRGVLVYDPVTKQYTKDDVLSDGQWPFHVWAEGWYKRSEFEGPANWQSLEATPDRWPNGVAQLAGPASQQSIATRQPWQFDSPYFWALANGDMYFENRGGPNDPWLSLPLRFVCGNHFRTQDPIIPGAFQVVTPLYNPFAIQQGNPLAATLDSPAALIVPEGIQRGDPATFTIRVRNSDGVARTFIVGWRLDFTRSPIRKDGLITSADGQEYELDPGETRDFSVSVPWSEFGAGLNPSRFLLASASVICWDANVRWARDQWIGVDPLPVSLSATPSGTVRFNDVVTLDLRFRNASPNAVQNSAASFTCSREMRFANNERELRVDLGSVAAGGDVHVLRAARMTERGSAAVSARVFSANATTQDVVARFTVVGCLGDLDGGDSVDDADFSLFVQSYDALTVPPGDAASDLNRDGVVDDLDFMLFVQAYDKLTCE